MAELTDAQKVNREVTQKRIAAALENMAQKSPTPTGGAAGQIPVKQSAAYGDTAWEYPQYCRRNLLDNGYFVGGGSQLGNGTFPINQREQQDYGAGAGIDRWAISSSPIHLTVKESGIELKRVSSSSSPHFSQTLSEKAPAGVYTASLIYKATLAEGDFVSIIVVANGSGLTIGTIDSSKTDWTLASFTFTATGPITAFRIQFLNASTQVEDAIELAAVKLERGGCQTLAHMENGAWVLNEIPDFGEELAKCQRYFQIFRTEALRPTYGADCRPTMEAEKPTKGTVTVDGVTYYTLTA